MAQIVIWGAGAIGGLVGAHLTRAGLDVLLVDRDRDHVEAMNSRGLLIDGHRGEFTVKVKACLPEDAPAQCEWVFLCVKCLFTEFAAEQVAKHLAPNGVVLSLQNGLNERHISRICGAERTVGAFIDFGSDYLGPGHIRHGNDQPIYIGELDGVHRPRLDTLKGWLSHFQTVIITDNIWGYLWTKSIRGGPGFVTAMIDAPTYEINANPLARKLMIQVAAEGVAVAKAQGIKLQTIGGFDPEIYDAANGRQAEADAALAARTTRPPGAVKVHTGIWRDLAVRKRKTEVDCIPGAVAGDARRLGIATPTLDRLIVIIHDIEEGRRPQDWSNLEALAGK